jgi:2-polyprenyl-3-methyl-5-hydroxy-6-metoxy-1,4-benzoquinol methylase
MKEIFETVPCNLCGSKKFDVVYESRRHLEKDKDLVKKFRASGDELLIDQLVKCKNCGLKFVNPRIKSKIIVDSYSKGSDEVFVSQAKAREKTFDNSLSYIEKFAKIRGKVLDVGTAGGSFLSAAKNRGWEVYGCEPNKWLANWGTKNYGFKISSGTIFEQKYKSSFFDLVTLWDVIEHTPDPKKVLKECNRVMKPGSFLVVNYPEIGSWLARLMGRKWLFLTSVHLYYFTPKTMSNLLKEAGFEIIIIRPHLQSLELGYLLFRAETYGKFIFSTIRKIVDYLGLGKKHLPYWLGQTFVLARKV